jgi:hypothetical protein
MHKLREEAPLLAWYKYPKACADINKKIKI